LTFIVLGLSFVAFGAGTLNLFFVLKANLNLLLEHGWRAVMDGGGRQLLELVLTGSASMAAYIVFKACEVRLTNWLAGATRGAPATTQETPPHEDRHPAG
jgi:hypothetical protein